MNISSTPQSGTASAERDAETIMPIGDLTSARCRRSVALSERADADSLALQ